MDDNKFEYAALTAVVLITFGIFYLMYDNQVRRNNRLDSCIKNHSVVECAPLLKSY